jgi:hypothetical protein
VPEHDANQGQAASVAVRRVTAERRARLDRLAARVAPADDAEVGVQARQHADGPGEVTVFMHHDGINTNVTVEPPKAVEDALRRVLDGALDVLRAQAGRDVVAHMMAAGAEPGEEE